MGLTVAFGVLAVLVFVGIAAIVGLPWWLWMVTALLSVVPIAFAVLAFFKSRGRHRQFQEAIDAAWVESARSVAASQGSLDVETLATALGISEQLAQHLIGMLGASSEFSTSITDDGKLELAMHGRVRVAQPVLTQPVLGQAVEFEEVAADDGRVDHRMMTP